MDIEKELERMLARITRRIDEMYLQALARNYNVAIKTVLIWRALGKV